MDYLRDTLRSLRAHAMRFTLTSLGILWGAFMLTYLSATMEGVDSHFTRELEETGPKILIAWPGSVPKERVADRGARPVEIEDDDVARIRKIHLVEGAAPDLPMWNRIVRSGRRTKLLTVGGVAPVTQKIRNFEIREGRFISPTDVERSARVAFLGPEAAERLFGREPVLNREIQIESQRFRVIGVAEAKGDQMIGVNGKDDQAVLVPYTTMQRLLDPRKTMSQILFAPLTRPESYSAIWRVRQVLGLHHDFDPAMETAVSFFNIHDIMQILNSVFLGLRIFMFSAGIVTLLVGAIGVMNIMLVVVAERTNEIGLRKAVGAHSRSIFLQFLSEATAVCSIAGFIGATLGVGATQLVAAITPPDSPTRSVPILDPTTVVVIAGSLILVGIVAGIVPAIRASQVEPAEALRAV